MKPSKKIALAAIVTTLTVVALGCSSNASSTSTTKTQTATVKKGNIALDITGTGNLAYSTTADLAFEMAGTVETVTVSAGDSVTQGQALAKLDTTDWDTQIKTLKKSLQSAQQALTNAKRQVAVKQLAVKQAQLDLESAQNAVSQIAAVKTAQDLVDMTQAALTAAKGIYMVDPNQVGTQITAIQEQLAQAQKNLRDILSGTSLNMSGDTKLQIQKAELQVDQSQMSLDSANASVDDANSAVEDAQQGVQDAQTSLDDASALTPVITAPFTGFITKVNVKGGDEVQKGTVAMQLADPDKFEANIQVNEDDVFSVKIGGTASVTLDAVSGAVFPAKITARAPLATVSQGVVSYQVTVELTPPQTPASGAASANQTGSASSGAPQAPAQSVSGLQPLASTQPLSLMDGLSANVDIVITQASNVLLVPSRAVTRQGQNYVVKVVSGSTTETRTVKTGASDGTNTEIMEGLSEGEQVVYTSGSSSSSSSSTQQQGMPGIGGIGSGGPPPGGF